MKKQIELAIRAMLTPGDKNEIGPGYVRDLLKRLERSRANHVGDVASMIEGEFLDGPPAETAGIRAAYLDELLCYAAPDMSRVLLKAMDVPGREGETAALLYLRGVERKWWRASAFHVERAQKLAASFTGTKPQSAAPKPKIKRENLDPLGEDVWLALRAGRDMRRVLDDPNGDHFCAVQRFFVAAELAGFGPSINAAFREHAQAKVT